jgi:hypothetical protein
MLATYNILQAYFEEDSRVLKRAVQPASLHTGVLCLDSHTEC